MKDLGVELNFLMVSTCSFFLLDHFSKLIGKLIPNLRTYFNFQAEVNDGCQTHAMCVERTNDSVNNSTDISLSAFSRCLFKPPQTI